MIIPTKKLKNGFELPVYGLGLWQMGGRQEPDTSRDSSEIEAIQNAIQQGVTHIDTAESYGAGHAEELLGQAIKGIGREKLILASKVSDINQSYEGLRKSFDASLKRVGTDYFDIYYLHRFPSADVDIADTMRALNELVAQGAIKHIGVSNMSVERFSTIQSLSHSKVICNQVHYNLQFREVEHKGLLKYCQDNDVFLMAYRPLQKGALETTGLLAEVAEKYHRTPYQIALNWLISQDNVITIAKTSNPEHLRENLGALDWQLDQTDVELLRSQYPNQQKTSDVIALDHPLDASLR
jgi:diketogulonate reductase-like aldo/keto reductase